MIATVLKATFPKIKVLLYRNYTKFVKNNFNRDIEAKLQNTVVIMPHFIVFFMVC